MDLEKKYHAKVMLAGEYGVILGSDALTIPLNIFSAQLAKRNMGIQDETEIRSVSNLRKLFTYIRSLPRNSFFASPDLAKLDQLLKSGYYIQSNIPQGYGVGSSGAVSALIYDQFFIGSHQLSPEKQWKDLATLESCFHGKSSGVDAMTCFMNEALHFMPGEKIRRVTIHPAGLNAEYRFFLLDSNIVYETGPLVGLFMNKIKKAEYSNLIKNEYFGLIKKFIDAMTGVSENDAALLFRAISDLQWNHFREMIPDHMEEAWISGQISNTYYLKLNGSGGGFLLGITLSDNKEEVSKMLDGQTLHWLNI